LILGVRIWYDLKNLYQVFKSYHILTPRIKIGALHFSFTFLVFETVTTRHGEVNNNGSNQQRRLTFSFSQCKRKRLMKLQEEEEYDYVNEKKEKEEEEPPLEDAKPIDEPVRNSERGKNKINHFHSFEFDGNQHTLVSIYINFSKMREEISNSFPKLFIYNCIHYKFTIAKNMNWLNQFWFNCELWIDLFIYDAIQIWSNNLTNWLIFCSQIKVTSSVLFFIVFIPKTWIYLSLIFN